MSTPTEPSDPTATLDERLRDGRPELGGGLAALRARVVAQVVRKQPPRVGRYVLGRTLGSGNFGTVYEARDAELDRRVAVKIVDARSSEQTARVVREAQLLAALSHPNVVPVFETGLTDDPRPSPYVVMELVEGQTVRQWLTQQPRPWREVVEVMLQAARGLEAAHRAGIVHRDFKPDNALLGADGRVRVVDFGLARTVGEPESTVDDHPPLGSDPLLTPSGAFLGTPAYMAPEAFAGESSPKADQYSLCVTLYEGLYGARPFAAHTIEELRAKLWRGAPRLPRGRGLPPAVGAVILRGLAREPDARFADLGELAAALEAALRPRRATPWLAAAVGTMGLAAAGLALVGPMPAVAPADSLASAEPAVDPRLAPVLAELEAEADALRPLVATAQLDAALARSAALVERARATGHGPALVEPLLLRGQALTLATDYEHAIPVVEESYFLAQDHDMPRAMAYAASELVGLWGYHSDEYAKAHRWQGHAEVAFERAGLDPRQYVPYMVSVAGLMTREGDAAGAIATLREALGHVERSDQAGRSVHAALLKHLARELYYADQVEEGLALLRRAIPMFEANDGPLSSTYATALDNLGVFLTNQGHPEQALEPHRKALQIREATLEPRHLDLARSYGNTGRVLGLLGQYDEAFELLDRSQALFVARLGPGNSSVAMSHELKGQIHQQRGPQGREDAIREYTQAARLYDGAGVIYAIAAERMRKAVEALGGTPPPRPSVPIPPEL